ncbi:MAG: hypothetical protein HKN75_05760 [Bacteroidia bacterium]|nr:hypothetical protein [Bacteroidia bacterium]
MKYSYYFVLLIVALAFNSCKEDEPIPAYIKIDAIDLTTDIYTEGWDTENIKDAWIYIDNELIGVYELPAEFPVLDEGSTTVSIGPGIFLNGISATRTPYPFYRFSDNTVNLVPENTTTISPTVTYFSNLNFPWIEDFESTGFNMTPTSASDTVMTQIFGSSNTNVEYGNGAAYIALDTVNSFFEIESDNKYVLPQDNSPVFLEIDYKSTIPFTVGVFAFQPNYTDQVPIVVVNPKDEWNKIYIELAFTLSDFPSANDFSFFIGTFLSNDLTFGEVYIDNIKLVYGN